MDFCVFEWPLLHYYTSVSLHVSANAGGSSESIEVDEWVGGSGGGGLDVLRCSYFWAGHQTEAIAKEKTVYYIYYNYILHFTN